MKLKNLETMTFSLEVCADEVGAMNVYDNCEVECRNKYELIEKIKDNNILHLTDLDTKEEYYINAKYVISFQLEEE